MKTILFFFFILLSVIGIIAISAFCATLFVSLIEETSDKIKHLIKR